MAKLPIVGAAYKNPSLIIDCQNTINWYPQAIELPNGAQRVSALIPTPKRKNKPKLSSQHLTAAGKLPDKNMMLIVVG
ncbi:hypothetical protein [Aquirhabdus parva]|uniref:Uncharacterized protein n=1 Tax=Aquirhabdus parva TaxID=2283318 RepID=A0A345PAW0_9GAMM|nr:hypothetical protein [Aquirhabdus parva]AXI04419.1 hypothetical protein HYN46_00005 [Aquirhabdus parva]